MPHPELLPDGTLLRVAVGTAGVGAVGGFVGTFAVIRHRSLQGDAIAHAALPGVMLAFLAGGRDPAALALGAAVTGWLAMAVVTGVSGRGRIPFDAALGGGLAVSFGLGLLLLSYITRHVPGGAGHGLDRYLFGQAAILSGDDLRLIAVAAAGVLAVVLALWPPFALLAFDPDFAATLGLPVRTLDLLLTALTVAAVVVGLQVVGVVLMSALLVAPAVAARQWTDRLGRLTALAAGIGAGCGFAGAVLADRIGGTTAVPTGPVVVLVATAAVLVSLPAAQLRRRFA